MDIVVLLEPLEGGRFRARAGDPLNLTAEGATAEEATGRLGALIDTLLANGRQITSISVTNGKTAPAPTHAFPADNLYQTDWVYRELQAAIAEGRTKDDAS